MALIYYGSLEDDMMKLSSTSPTFISPILSQLKDLASSLSWNPKKRADVGKCDKNNNKSFIFEIQTKGLQEQLEAYNFDDTNVSVARIWMELRSIECNTKNMNKKMKMIQCSIFGSP